MAQIADRKLGGIDHEIGPRAHRLQQVALLAIDEAHCVCEWGYDFRPSYLRLVEARRRLRPSVTVALTGEFGETELLVAIEPLPIGFMTTRGSAVPGSVVETRADIASGGFGEDGVPERTAEL